jgi:alginate O-acetyltransferase complex protein AlgI
LNLQTGMRWCGVLAVLAFVAPSSNNIGNQLLKVNHDRPAVRPFVLGVALAAVAFLLIVNATRKSVSAFIYFNF